MKLRMLLSPIPRTNGRVPNRLKMSMNVVSPVDLSTLIPDLPDRWTRILPASAGEATLVAFYG